MGKRTTPAAVDRIARLEDPVLRNLQITQSYYELSLEFLQRTGSCANWCTFATWASRQAGQSIRKEDLAKALEHRLTADPVLSQAIYDIVRATVDRGARIDKQGVVKLVWEAVNPNAMLSRASAAVARGNQKVYAEIGREFARFLASYPGDGAYDAQYIARFCSALQPGDPPDGQRYLRQAFERYYRAFFEADTKQKAELILLANIEIGFHEQTRLQPEIAEALDAAVMDPGPFRDQLLKALFPAQNWLGFLSALVRRIFNRPTLLDTAIDQFVAVLRQRIRLFLTAHMMELGFAKGMILHLGEDLQAPFPPDLEKLANPDLLDLLKKMDPTPDSLLATGALDWAKLDDRLHFIIDLFRCYQESPDLLLPPFEAEGV